MGFKRLYRNILRSKQIFYLKIKSNYNQGLKRSVTTLRGGSLGYAEIVAVKVLLYFLKLLVLLN